MDKQTVLEKSRAENKNGDEREHFALGRATNVGSAVGGLVCALFIVLSVVFDDIPTMCVAFGVYLSITGTTLFVKFCLLKKKHELFFGLIEWALAVAFIVFYVVSRVNA
ncbi:MAG: hypothetical protein J5993_02895 [Clostridia bacterium]|nr:hypothetical protein [Clostridia bacterium]